MENGSIPQFIPIRSRVADEELGKYGSQTPYVLVDAGSWPLAVKAPAPLLALPNPRVDPHVEEVEIELGASQ